MATQHTPGISDVDRLSALYQREFGVRPDTISPLRAHGSDRRIYRVRGRRPSVVGVVHENQAENRAFLSFSQHFRTAGVPVPEIIAVEEGTLAYLEEDLGDETLFEMLQRRRGGEPGVPDDVAAVYDRVAAWLPEIQVRVGRGIDFSICHPRASFDRQSMAWDLNYFKYHFLKLAHVPFDEQALENDFTHLIDFLLRAPAEFFLYRDLQSRNVMVRQGEPWFIDYQGGRRGALHYDLASLLVDAKANLPHDFRARLVEQYLDALRPHVPVDREEFGEFFDGFTLIRLLQAMGAYGYRGFYERKPHFLQSVPYALRNIEHLLQHARWPVKLPALRDTLQAVLQQTHLREPAGAAAPLTVRIESFSFKRGWPADVSGHGGGFVFDCRLLPNPGREERFRASAGDEADVEAWLEGNPEVRLFFARTTEIVSQAVDSYRARGFTHLSVSFGCTGGQHRSVYGATQLARLLRQRAGVQVELHHRDVIRRDATAAAP